MSGQTISDRFLAAKHSIAGQGLAKSVCKATTEEVIGPKKKHLDYLLHCTNEPNVSIPQLANLLIERSQNTNWIVVFKALITVHHLMCYGNERFTQYLASSNCSFQLSNFLDKTGVAGQSYDMSPFIRRYAKYLNEKAVSYRNVAFDFCKVKRGKDDGTLRTMNTDKLLKTLPGLQTQLDALLEFDCTASELTNGVINTAFMLLFRDLIRLFACYNDGIINLLEKYFDMNKKQCRDALDLYKKFLIRMDRVSEFLKVAENVGIHKADIPDLTKAPGSLLDALEQHLASLEGKKGSAGNTPTQTNKVNIKTAVSALSSTSSAFGTAANATGARIGSEDQQNGTTAVIDDNLKKQALAEEAELLNQYKERQLQNEGGIAPSTNPFLSSPVPTGNAQPIIDLFGASGASTSPAGAPAGAPIVAPAGPGQPSKASDDLLQLTGNPFADIISNTSQPQAVTAPVAPAGNSMWGMQNGFGAPASAAPVPAPAPAQPFPQGGNFVAESQFSTAFGGTATQGNTGFDAFGDVLQPMAPAGGGSTGTSPTPGAQHSKASAGKVITGDLDSSLASLAENLTINKGGQPVGKGMQWNSPKGTAKTGGSNWTAQPQMATAGAGYRPPMAQGMAAGSVPGQFQQPMQPMGMRPMAPMSGAPMMGSGGGMMGNVMGGTPMMGGLTQQPRPPVSTKQNQQLDPFGAL